ncbi:hypothetical protein EIP91_005421 [Steccherinum ochraceum]|uniref:Uncharacterized protein n=1 Tax=Steccherinum ochraceum TaxID=92696 RepID=A0A4R0R746_9APHY|nr:hypothetical protein EIP91_005421 [Steccherinum ochraceum]
MKPLKSKRRRSFPISGLGLACTVVLLCNIVQVVFWMKASRKRPCEDTAAVHLPSLDSDAYTWEGDDFPPYLPLQFGSPVELTLQNSVHYALDSPEADAEYQSLYPGTQLGFVHLGPHKRFFGLSMFHQFHCLDSLRKAILGRGHHASTNHSSEDPSVHAAHCLDYLRQTILCAADVTLEPEVPVEGSRDVGEGVGVRHVCRDWSKVYEFATTHQAVHV